MTAARSVAIGAAIAVANLWLLAQMVRGFLARKGATTPFGIIAVLKFVALFGAMYVLVKTRSVDILPCVFGYAALPVGIVFAQVLGGSHQPEQS
jgi:hydrogenase/urease accessory protein HupE